MKLVIAVIQGTDAEALVTGLVRAGLRATQVNSSGGFLRESNVTLLIGIEDHDVPRVRAIIRNTCHSRTAFVNPLMPIVEPGEAMLPVPVEVSVGGATMFVVEVRQFVRFPQQVRS